MFSPVTGRRVIFALFAALALLSGGCATLDRDIGQEGFEPRKTSLWIKPPAEDGHTPIVGFTIPW